MSSKVSEIVLNIGDGSASEVKKSSGRGTKDVGVVYWPTVMACAYW